MTDTTPSNSPAPDDMIGQLAELLAEKLRATPLAPAKPAYDPDALSAAFDSAHEKFLSAESDARARFVAALEKFLVDEALPLAGSIGLAFVPGGSAAALVLGLVVHEGLPILQALEARSTTSPK